MKKRIMFIIIAFILLMFHYFINLKYNSKVTEVEILQEKTEKKFVSEYVWQYVEKLSLGLYDEAYALLEDKDYPSKSEFEKYISSEIIGEKSVFSVQEIEKENDIYKTVVQISLPLYATTEEMKQKIYQEKRLSVDIKLGGIFDYRILNIEKVEE